MKALHAVHFHWTHYHFAANDLIFSFTYFILTIDYTSWTADAFQSLERMYSIDSDAVGCPHLLISYRLSWVSRVSYSIKRIGCACASPHPHPTAYRQCQAMEQKKKKKEKEEPRDGVRHILCVRIRRKLTNSTHVPVWKMPINWFPRH